MKKTKEKKTEENKRKKLPQEYILKLLNDLALLFFATDNQNIIRHTKGLHKELRKLLL